MAEKLSRERIVKAAFHAWGRTLFKHTGLHLVARELGVTKPAMYRYFRNKDEIIGAMKDEFDEYVRENIIAPLITILEEHRSTGIPVEPEQLVRGYFTGLFRHFNTRPNHYIFYLHRLIGRTVRESADPGTTRNKLETLLTSLFERSTGYSATAAPSARYLTMSGVFWITHHYRNVLGKDPLTDPAFDPPTPSFSPDQMIFIVEAATDHFIRGFARDVPPRVDYTAVERIASLSPEELTSPDRTVTAITTVVQEYGYAGATVDRIAGELGVTKSSLYHYFKNRNEMLSRMLIQIQEQFASLAALRFRQLRSDEDRLYGFFVLLSDYALLCPGSTIMGNWIRESNIEVHIPTSWVGDLHEKYGFIADMLMRLNVADSREEAFEILWFIGFIVMQETTLRTGHGTVAGPNRPALRDLFMQFTAGRTEQTEKTKETPAAAAASRQGDLT